ncbi:MAG: carbohydrate binding family 9 domain-containing protein, partial [Acidobacteriota bacterium]|nr:carbohydrate binding family 9 domain-containing protein [Acidobacteriota bacterium]
MKKFYAFLAIIFFAIYTNAQPANSNVSSNSDDAKTVTKKSPDDKDKTDSANKSKIIVPPEKANPVKVGKITIPVVIDGRLDDEMWKTAVVFKDFIQTGPGDNIAPSKPTEAYLAYDERNLYIAFKCWDERDKIRATVAKRDEVFGEDNVRVWLDTYNDQRRAYVLGWNPLGIQQDGIYTEGQGADFSVDIVMESKGVIEDWGWSVEAKIPFKSLRYAAGKGKLWGFNAARNIDRFNDEFD